MDRLVEHAGNILLWDMRILILEVSGELLRCFPNYLDLTDNTILGEGLLESIASTPCRYFSTFVIASGMRWRSTALPRLIQHLQIAKDVLAEIRVEHVFGE
jgi:hypothetical protein